VPEATHPAHLVSIWESTLGIAQCQFANIANKGQCTMEEMLAA
jgi:hypothetical protein